MNKIEKLVLIEGDFEAEQATEILMNIFSTKIHFHEMKNFSSQEQFGEHDEIAQKRIPALRNEMKKLEEILSEAKNKKLLIHSEIHISLIDD